MGLRRLLLGASWALLLPGRAARALQRAALNDPLRLGVDSALWESGLAQALQRGFGRDTGLVVQLVSAPAIELLQALERGEMDAALANAPVQEDRLEQQGLVHDRHRVAAGDFVLVGPSGPPGGRDPAGISGVASPLQALVVLRDAALAAPGGVTFLSPGDGSGTHVAEQALWRLAKTAPAAPWYVAADRGSPLVEQARARAAYALVERGAWAAGGGKPLALLAGGAAAWPEEVHVMRAFRVNNPAGKIFVSWLGGAKAQQIVAAQRGYRRPPA